MMAFYASFDMEYNDKTIRDFLYEFFGDCECMAHMPEGLVFYMDNDMLKKIEVKDLKKIVFGRDHIVAFFNNDSNKRTCIIKYKSIKYLEVIPPNIARWSD